MSATWLTGEPPAALRRRIVLERAAWQLVRTMLTRHGVETRTGDPLDWMRGN